MAGSAWPRRVSAISSGSAGQSWRAFWAIVCAMLSVKTVDAVEGLVSPHESSRLGLDETAVVAGAEGVADQCAEAARTGWVGAVFFGG